jgi:hypothetical protein
MSSSFNSPDCRDDSGSDWHHKHLLDQESAERSMVDGDETLGFRLAREARARTLYGGAWRFSSSVAGEPSVTDANAPFHGSFIGFRLTWERT